MLCHFAQVRAVLGLQGTTSAYGRAVPILSRHEEFVKADWNDNVYLKSTMSSERQARIGLLSRVASGKQVLPSYLAALSSATGSEITLAMLTDLPEYDSLLEHFQREYKKAKAPGSTALSVIYSKERKRIVFSVTSCFARWLNEPIFLLTKQSETCGAVRLEGCHLLQDCDAILALDGDAVMVLSQDRSQGMLLDCNADDTACCYELTVWGDRWPPAMHKCGLDSPQNLTNRTV